MELKTVPLSKAEKQHIMEQVEAGVPNERILQNARKDAEGTFSRWNLISSQDINNTVRSYKRPEEDLIAVSNLVKKWNATTNIVFLYKKYGKIPYKTLWCCVTFYLSLEFPMTWLEKITDVYGCYRKNYAYCISL